MRSAENTKGSRSRLSMGGRVASWVLAAAGLILLVFFFMNYDIPCIRIGDVTSEMNFTMVRISGEVVRDARVLQSGEITFILRDASGEIAVLGGRAQAEALTIAGQLPRRGDRVDVTGSVIVDSGKKVKLRLQSSRQLVLKSRRSAFSSVEYSALPLAEVTVDRQGDYVTVAAVLSVLDIPAPGAKTPYVLTLAEEGTELPVIFWNDAFQGLENNLPTPGKTVRATGRVEVYRDRVQLKVRSADDLSWAKNSSSEL